jgi:5-methylcytosine-specific restriction endonuclease McrA
MALGRCLLSYAIANKETISLNDLSKDFLDLYIEKVKLRKPQGGSLGKKTYVEQEIFQVIHAGKREELALEVIREKSLKEMVLRKFHNLNDRTIPLKFYTFSDSKLTLTSNMLNLPMTTGFHNFESEISSRWDLLEHAFASIHNIESLDVDQYLQHIIKAEERIVLTSLINTLTGYQQGRCFYCGEDLYDIEVDHVIPYKALKHNQIWNLVLAHSFCNQNKSDNIPPLQYIGNMINRNEFFIDSSHPIKDTLVRQLGTKKEQRREKILSEYTYAKNWIVRLWGGHDKYDPSSDPYYKMAVKYIGSRI